MTPQTLLHRQVHPSWIQEGRVTSQVFRPTPKDANQLSVYDGDQISPREAWLHYSEKLRLNSAGVLSVSVQECTQAKLTVHPDGLPFREHASINFGAKSKSETKAAAEDLRSCATRRGWQFRAS